MDPTSTIASADLPGGRHDNDFEDFRSVDILPSVEEIQCKRDPYLPEILPPLSISIQGASYCVVICDVLSYGGFDPRHIYLLCLFVRPPANTLSVCPFLRASPVGQWRHSLC